MGNQASSFKLMLSDADESDKVTGKPAPDAQRF
jgi:hypothetical protein